MNRGRGSCIVSSLASERSVLHDMCLKAEALVGKIEYVDFFLWCCGCSCTIGGCGAAFDVCGDIGDVAVTGATGAFVDGTAVICGDGSRLSGSPSSLSVLCGTTGVDM